MDKLVLVCLSTLFDSANDLNLMNSLQGTRETLRRHVQDFGDLLCKENDVGLIIDGQVSDL